MGLNNTPSGERIHIGIFGKRNAGKSSVINRITGQNLAIVSDIKGTTTDPVSKAMELLPLGPVVMIDTPGIDDEGELGELRIKKAYQVLNKTDIAVLVVDGTIGMTKEDDRILEKIREKKIPVIIVMNKLDEISSQKKETIQTIDAENRIIWVSAESGENIYELKELIGKNAPVEKENDPIIRDLLMPSDLVVLVVPIDSAAPKGRIILPQQQTIRDILEADAVSVIVREYELKSTLENLGKRPRLVVTDSQVFAEVAKDTPEDILLTSFSILMARHKGDLPEAVRGAKAIETLQEGDKVLIGEGCTHHKQCDDIGTVKLPNWMINYIGKKIDFEFTSGTQFPEDLSKYKMVVHCGGCMLNEKEMKYRIKSTLKQQIPITNYGIMIAYIKGILMRSVEAFPEIAEELQEKSI